MSPVVPTTARPAPSPRPLAFPASVVEAEAAISRPTGYPPQIDGYRAADRPWDGPLVVVVRRDRQVARAVPGAGCRVRAAGAGRANRVFL